jgi:large subunit ribosomal protein L21
MMYAIISQGGKQYRVVPGDEIVCEKVGGKAGDPVAIDKLLLVSEGDKTMVTGEELAKFKIEAELVENFSNDKVLVFKYRAKKGYRRMHGHRQAKSRVKIVSIAAGAAPAVKTATKAKEKKTAVKPAVAKKTAAKPAAKTKSATATKERPKKTGAKKAES